MKQVRQPPGDLVARCLLMQRGTYWVAMCIDLDLVAQASSAAQAQKMLGEQMISYVSEAVFQASPSSSKLAATHCRIEFVFLRTASSLPVALHPASRRRSYFQLRGLGLP